MKRILAADVVRGSVAPGFEEVREVFVENFRQRGDIGAACAVYLRGEKVVDLWGGQRDLVTGAPWEEDTMVLVFSTTKGMSALALAVAHSRGLFQYDEPIATYWPEFAQEGKARVTVRELLAHEAGLPVVDAGFDVRKLADLDGMAVALAAQRPAWAPGRKHGYHGISLGWYESELLRRVDPQRRSIGRFFQDEVAKPLGIEFHIGLPRTVPVSRLARIRGFRKLDMALHLHTIPPRFALAMLDPRSLTARAFANPRLANPADLDTPDFRAIEMPSSNGVGQARAIARAYGVFATGGAELGITAETRDALFAPAVVPPLGRQDEILKVDTAFSLGFLKPSPLSRFGSSDSAFGTPGMGGSFGFADPDLGLGFAYVMNRMGFYLADDPREKALRDATYRCLR